MKSDNNNFFSCYMIVTVFSALSVGVIIIVYCGFHAC